MKKGIVRISVGVILIVLQILSMIGNAYAEDSPQFKGNIIYLLGYYLVGIIGLIMIAWGVVALFFGTSYNRVFHSNTTRKTTVIKYISIVLLMLGFVTALSDFSITNYNGNCYIISILFLILYLTLHQGRCPSRFLSASFALLGIGHILGIFRVLMLYVLYDFDYQYILVPLFECLMHGILYTIIAVMVYSERNFSKPIRILGYVSFGVYLIWAVYSNRGNVTITHYDMLMIVVFLWSSIVPISTNSDKENKNVEVFNEDNSN